MQQTSNNERKTKSHMKNEKEYRAFLKERMDKGYSFKFIKGSYTDKSGFTERINIAIKCFETKEMIKMEWDH